MGFCIFEGDSTDLVKSFINFKMGLADLGKDFFTGFEMGLADLGRDFNGFIMDLVDLDKCLNG